MHSPHTLLMHIGPQGRIRRRRWRYLAVLLISFLLALLSRWFGAWLPAFVAAYAGDYFSGPMAFGLMGILFPRLRVWQLGLLSLLFAWGIEAQQLIRAPWLVDIRATRLGTLFLGTTFVWSDIWCLLAGVATATGLEYAWYRRLRNKA